MNLVIQCIYLALFLFFVALLARVVTSIVVQFSRHWGPGPRAAAFFEVVFTITDPPLRGLRKLIPPLRIGNVSLDLAFLIVIFATVILMNVVGANIR
ncbi:YggT family protein [Haloglycomyces albus]|uniref:YggT family protein n=1 Tax=Haloglycomyces albus TaxID=526067 RepID=UPI0004B0C766|nr:YggT family protein [Haloglycomyces albus]